MRKEDNTGRKNASGRKETVEGKSEEKDSGVGKTFSRSFDRDTVCFACIFADGFL